ncbi:aldehyde dehydrogenase (NADP(+)) [Marinactinospora thermotolerans]|uniref:aldehyde dehydrogenase (NADP(+)) n=1 Tax=Marinactinospora thermotolerans TaxID=531310 RepID=UPI003D928059
MVDQAEVLSIDPRTGKVAEVVATESSPEEVAALCAAAAQAAPELERLGRAARVRMLRAMAAALEADRETIVGLADRETALGAQRLNGELTRTRYQFELFADAVEEGSYLEAVIDHPMDTPMGPRPDLRRMLMPLGPVAVFGAGNFPLAFSVPGGDTVAALAAGCPVVVKAHPGHPATSQRCFEVMAAAALEAGAPRGVLGLVHGQEAGALLVTDPRIKAVGFTGSLRGGRALFDLAAGRPDPIPFYGELGSVNPLVVTPRAADQRAGEIAEGIVGSFTMGQGQFCTKPGLVFLPEGESGEAVATAMAEAVSGRAAGTLLSQGIREGYLSRSAALSEATRVLAEGAAPGEDGWQAPVLLLATEARRLDAEVAEECFGPLTLVVTYQDEEELMRALSALPGSLTGTVLSARETQDATAQRAAARLRDFCGRVVFNGFPTGVAVSAAMTHGGPWPATTDPLHTSVGLTSIRRFLRPVTWQNAPQEVLPEELRDGFTGVPRRVDGRSGS